MPAFRQILSPEEITDVIAYVRDLQLDAMATLDIPGEEACLTAPRTVEAIQALVETPAVSPDPPPVDPSAGEPADQATVNAIAATTRELIACDNAGDRLRQLALFSDESVRASYANGVPETSERAGDPDADPSRSADRVTRNA